MAAQVVLLQQGVVVFSERVCEVLKEKWHTWSNRTSEEVV